MLSFISNFKKMNLMGQSMLIAIMLTIAYAIFAPILFPHGGVPQNQAQENLIRVQDFLFSEKTPRLVLAGSSMGARLDPAYFPKNFSNLAMSGGSPLTGLDIVIASEKFPEILLLEMNDTILREADDVLVSQVKESFHLKLLRALPVFRERFEPICVFAALFKPSASANQADDAVAGLGLEFAIQEALDRSTLLSDREKLLSAMEKINKKILYLTSHGVKVLFFDPPMDPRLEKSVRVVSYKKMFQEFFSHQDTYWIPTVNAEEYRTSDGMHLLQGSAARYAKHLLNSLPN